MIDARKREVDGVTVLDLAGTLDLDGANLLKDKLQEIRQSGASLIVLNMERLTSAQSTVLQHLTTPIRALTVTGGKLALAGMNDSVGKVMEKGMFFSMVVVFDAADEAISSLSTAS